MVNLFAYVKFELAKSDPTLPTKKDDDAVELCIAVKIFEPPTTGMTLDAAVDAGEFLVRGVELVVEFESWLEANTAGRGLGADEVRLGTRNLLELPAV